MKERQYGLGMDMWAMATSWVAPLGAAAVGAAAGGLAAWSLSTVESRRARRERYGHALLEALGGARIAVQAERDKALNAAALDRDGLAPDSSDELPTPLVLRREARDIWIHSHLAATLERRSAGKRALSGWALHHHEFLLAGSQRTEELEHLDSQLQLGEFLVVAWVSGKASGRDFALPAAAAYERFAPRYTDADVPDYAPGPYPV